MKIGFFGGTFSPPHKGHIRAAKLFLSSVGLDRLIIMPAGIPPHKEAAAGAAAADRLEMARLAFGAFAEVSDYEINKTGKSYTVETLRYLKGLHPNDEIYMLVGEDMFLSLDTWRAPEEICRLAVLTYIRRTDECDGNTLQDAATRYRERYGARVLCIDSVPLEMSSTEIRAMVFTDDGLVGLTTPEVSSYIKEHGLYK